MIIKRIKTYLREEAKTLKYFQAYKQLDDIHFEPFVVEVYQSISRTDDTQETRRMMHSSGPEHAPRKGGAENKKSPANDYILLIE